MSQSMRMRISRSDFRGLKKMQRESPAAFKKALGAGALQLMTWMNTGSPREDRTPPIRWGILRGSASAFVGSTLVGVGPGGKDGTPLQSYSAKSQMTVTIIYNTAYAARMHEWAGGWGEATVRAGNAGNKWIERHLSADKDAFLEVVGAKFKKEAGL